VFTVQPTIDVRTDCSHRTDVFAFFTLPLASNRFARDGHHKHSGWVHAAALAMHAATSLSPVSSDRPRWNDLLRPRSCRWAATAFSSNSVWSPTNLVCCPDKMIVVACTRMMLYFTKSSLCYVPCVFPETWVYIILRSTRSITIYHCNSHHCLPQVQVTTIDGSLLIWQQML